MQGTDALDATTIIATVGAFQASPPLGFVAGVMAVGIAVARRSPDVQRLLIGECVPDSRAARYFFKRPAPQLSSPTQPVKAAVRGLSRASVAEFLAPRQPAYPAPVEVRSTAPAYRSTPVHAALSLPAASEDAGTLFVVVGYDEAGDDVTVPIKHGVIANSTGGGKTNTLDLIVGQLVAAGVEVWAATPKYVPIDPIDRLPRHLIYDAIPVIHRALRPDAILPWLQRAAKTVEDRYGRMQTEPGWFPEPLVIVLDELKAYLRLQGKRKDTRGVSYADQVNDAVQTVLTLGRESNVFLIFTSQDGYCGSIEMTRGEIGNLGFRLVHPTLDENSRKNLLPSNLPPGSALGPYAWYCAVGNDVRIVSIPRVTPQMFAGWGLTQRTTEPLRPHTPATAALPARDPWEDWTAQLLASAAEPSATQALAYAVKRGKASKVLALALCGDEAAAIRALSAAGMAQREIARLWGGNTQRTNQRIGAILGNRENDENSEDNGG